MARKLCDGPGCDIPICDRHATPATGKVAGDKLNLDYCPEHKDLAISKEAV
jgi:hypothetical protein